MADLLLDTQAVPSTPAAGKMIVFPHNGIKKPVSKDDAGVCQILSGALRNSNTADVVANAADTYLTGSSIAIPTGILLQAQAIFRWKFFMTKSAAGTAAPIWIVRVGTNSSVADTARLTFTQVALQTGVVDTGIVEIVAVLRNIGASGVLAGGLWLSHVLAATGFSTLTDNVLQVTSAGFDTTIAGTVIGVSVNPGSLGVWTHQVVTAEMGNI